MLGGSRVNTVSNDPYMSKTKIKIDQSEAKAKIDVQIANGKKLGEQGWNILRDTQTNSIGRGRAKDSFVVLFDQWCDFTIEIVDHIFVSNIYARRFKETKSSQHTLVGSHWSPDVDYYLRTLLIPKIDYLSILSESIEQFQKEDPSRSQEIVKEQRDTNLEMPGCVTLAWLWRHVPYTFWFGLVGLLVSAFSLGLYVGQLEFVQEWISRWK